MENAVEIIEKMMQAPPVALEMPAPATDQTSGPPEPDRRAFEYGHLSTYDQNIVAPYCNLAIDVLQACRPSPARARVLNSLLDAMAHARDAAKVEG